MKDEQRFKVGNYLLFLLTIKKETAVANAPTETPETMPTTNELKLLEISPDGVKSV